MSETSKPAFVPYPDGRGEYLEYGDIRVEVYPSGSWVVYSINKQPFRCVGSSETMKAGKDMDEAKALAREGYKKVVKMVREAYSFSV